MRTVKPLLVFEVTQDHLAAQSDALVGHLACDDPRMIVVTARPIDVRGLADAAARIDWRIVVEPLADDAFRLALPSPSLALTKRVFERVLRPLDDSAGIVMLKMGAA